MASILEDIYNCDFPFFRRARINPDSEEERAYQLALERLRRQLGEDDEHLLIKFEDACTDVYSKKDIANFTLGFRFCLRLFMECCGEDARD